MSLFTEWRALSENHATQEEEIKFWEEYLKVETAIYNEILNNKMEVVIFGTCLNGSLEMGNVFKDYANYFVASEEISWSFSNTSDLAFISKIETTDNGSEVGVKFIEQYKSKMDEAKWNYGMNGLDYTIYSTYSLVDLNKIDDLNKDLNNFFKFTIYVIFI